MTYVWSLKKKGTNELIYKTEIESQMQKTNLRSPGDKAGSVKLEEWDWHIYTTIHKIDN